MENFTDIGEVYNTTDGEMFTIDNAFASPTVVLGNDCEVSSCNTITITTSGLGTTDLVMWMDESGQILHQWESADPVEEMKDLVSLMTEEFMEKYR